MVDVNCYDDLSLFGDELDDDAAELEQDLWHRLLETPGENIDDPARGVGLIDSLSGGFDSSLAHRIQADFMQDDRVQSVDASVEETSPGVFKVAIYVTPDVTIIAEVSQKTGVRRLLAP